MILDIVIAVEDIVLPVVLVLCGDDDLAETEAELLPGIDAEVLHSKSDLYRQLKDWAFKSNVEIVIAALRRSVPASVKVSQNAVAASCSQALHRLYSHVEDKSLVLRDAETFFGDPSSLIYRQVSMEVIEHEGKSGIFARRAGCCLVWRTRGDNTYCSNCILRSREEQTLLFMEMQKGVN